MEALLGPHLPIIWLFMIGSFLLYYAITDGFDLGIGMISLFAHSEKERDQMMGSIESIWHDNQTWLLLLGGMMFGAFPLFYGLVLSALYIPILVMLFGLMFRGVAFEFRALSRGKFVWNMAFGLGSLLVAIAQGMALGGLLGGMEMVNERFTGGSWDWLTPYSLLVTAGVICGYIMLGANYLILKTNGEIQERSYRYSFRAAMPTLIIAACVHLWTSMKYPHMANKWHIFPDVNYVALFFFLAVFSFFMYLYSLSKRREMAPLLWNAALILFSFVDVSIGLYPVMIPHMIASPITIQRAAASPETLLFMLVAMVLLLPVIVCYTFYKHRVFRGKVSGEAETEIYGE